MNPAKYIIFFFFGLSQHQIHINYGSEEQALLLLGLQSRKEQNSGSEVHFREGTGIRSQHARPPRVTLGTTALTLPTGSVSCVGMFPPVLSSTDAGVTLRFHGPFSTSI